MALEIDFIDETNEAEKEQTDLIENLLLYAAKEEGITDKACELVVTFVTNKEIQQINQMYRSKNVPTDVISFPMETLGEGETEIIGGDMPRVLGDIVISLERAKEQAKEYGHSLNRELGFLAVHGFLHLLGYDHLNPSEEERMFKRQEDILQSYGLKR